MKSSLVALATIVALCAAAPQFGVKIPTNGPVLAISAEDLIPLSMETIDSSEEVFLPLTNEQTRLRLMKYMRKLEREMDEDILEKDVLDIESALFKLNNKLWPKMVDVSEKIFNTLNDAKAIERENKIRLGLRQDVARLRFKAGARICQSPDEAFYTPAKGCVAVGSSDAELNVCAAKKDQVLYDGAGNKGICDCVDDDRHLVYYAANGECYRQNEQGPCQNGTWLTINNGELVCEEIPVNCPADGQHIYWSFDPLVAKPQCLQLGARGPCLEGHVLGYDKSGLPKCFDPLRPQSPIQLRLSCPLGSHRGQTEQCSN